MMLLLEPRVRSFAVAGLALVMPTFSIGAQEPRRLAQPESVPFELATALTGVGGLAGEPQILVGALPGWVNNRVPIPAGARVLGSAFVGTMVVGVLRASEAPETIIASLRTELPKHGWSAPPPAPSYGGGFRSASMQGGGVVSPAFLNLCADQQMLTVSARRRQGTTTQIVLRIVSGGYNSCNPRPMPPGMARSALPTLYNPAGAEGQGSECGADFGGNGTTTKLHTSMEPAAVLDHYARQLQDSGWQSPSNGARIVGRTWTRVDSAGVPLELSLTVATSPRDSLCRDLNLQLRTLRQP